MDSQQQIVAKKQSPICYQQIETNGINKDILRFSQVYFSKTWIYGILEVWRLL
jgi:hypothetical protein